jgi:hypothetical protein
MVKMEIMRGPKSCMDQLQGITCRTSHTALADRTCRAFEVTCAILFSKIEPRVALCGSDATTAPRSARSGRGT